MPVREIDWFDLPKEDRIELSQPAAFDVVVPSGRQRGRPLDDVFVDEAGEMLAKALLKDGMICVRLKRFTKPVFDGRGEQFASVMRVEKLGVNLELRWNYIDVAMMQTAFREPEQAPREPLLKRAWAAFVRAGTEDLKYDGPRG